MNNLRNGLGSRVDGNISVGGLFIWIIDTSETFNLACSCPLKDSLTVRCLTVLERRRDMDKEEVSASTCGAYYVITSGFAGVCMVL